MMRAAIVRFPGSNCDLDTLRAAEQAGCEASLVWHRETDLGQADVVLVPGGFSYGDYLRAGAIARFSPIMKAVQRHAAAGGPTLGICNGFQILCEAGLLPGALLPNAGLTFVSKPVRVRVERTRTPFTAAYERDEIVRLPVAHGEGRYVADRATIAELEAEDRIVLRYLDGDNPNGSTDNIAGICSAAGNVVGIMPHPERVADLVTGSDAGQRFFSSMTTWTVTT